MIAIDTNVLLRYLLEDDVKQTKKATAIINGSEQVLVTDIVLAETIWTLKGKKYKLDKDSIVNVVNALFAEPNIRFEDQQTVWRALSDYTKAKSVKVGSKKKSADFPDALIVNKARFESNKSAETLNGVYTFDVAAQEIPGTKKP